MERKRFVLTKDKIMRINKPVDFIHIMDEDALEVTPFMGRAEAENLTFSKEEIPLKEYRYITPEETGSIFVGFSEEAPQELRIPFEISDEVYFRQERLLSSNSRLRFRVEKLMKEEEAARTRLVKVLDLSFWQRLKFLFYKKGRMI